jgi:hypothetical protein
MFGQRFQDQESATLHVRQAWPNVAVASSLIRPLRPLDVPCQPNIGLNDVARGVPNGVGDELTHWELGHLSVLEADRVAKVTGEKSACVAWSLFCCRQTVFRHCLHRAFRGTRHPEPGPRGFLP